MGHMELNDLTLSSAAAPAKTLASQGDEQGSAASVLGFSPSTCELWGCFAPDMSFGKTSGVLCPLTEEQTLLLYSAPSRVSGTMRNGRCYVLPISAIRIEESGYSWWRTPSDPTKRGGSQPPSKRKQGGHTVNLEDQAEHIWQTPTATERPTRRQVAKEELELLLPGQAERLLSRHQKNGGVLSHDGRGSRPRLNPVFVEWLMGFPLLWTQPDASA
jgi:hypothetical protein